MFLLTSCLVSGPDDRQKLYCTNILSPGQIMELIRWEMLKHMLETSLSMWVSVRNDLILVLIWALEYNYLFGCHIFLNSGVECSEKVTKHYSCDELPRMNSNGIAIMAAVIWIGVDRSSSIQITAKQLAKPSHLWGKVVRISKLKALFQINSLNQGDEVNPKYKYYTTYNPNWAQHFHC